MNILQFQVAFVVLCLATAASARLLHTGNSSSASQQSQQLLVSSSKAWQLQLPSPLRHSRSSINSRVESIAKAILMTGKQHTDMLGLERIHAQAQQLSPRLGHAADPEAAHHTAPHSQTPEKTLPNGPVTTIISSGPLHPSSHQAAICDHTDDLGSSSTAHEVGSNHPAKGKHGSLHPGHTSINGYLRNLPQPGNHNGPSKELPTHKHAHRVRDTHRHQPSHASRDSFRLDKHKPHNLQAMHPSHTNIEGYLARVQFEQVVSPSHTNIDGYLAKVSDLPSPQDLVRLTRWYPLSGDSMRDVLAHARAAITAADV